MPRHHILSALLLTLLLLLFSVPSHAENRLDQMVVPISNPATFEDPRPISELRMIFMWHEIDDGFFTAGGDQQVYGVQARVALDKRLSLVVNRAGFYDLSPESFAEGGSGLSDLELGAKYTFHLDKNRGTAAAVGLGWQMPTGNRDVFQGRGDGGIHPYISGAMALRGYNIMGSTGLRLPFSDEESAFWDVNLHIDSPSGNFVPLFELNFVQSINDGERLVIKDEGADLINFGASDASGDPLITSTIGTRYRLGPGLDWGIGYQTPLTSGSGSEFFKWRITTDLSYSFAGY